MLNGLVNSKNDTAIVTAFLAVVTVADEKKDKIVITLAIRELIKCKSNIPAVGAPQVFTNVNTNWIPK